MKIDPLLVVVAFAVGVGTALALDAIDHSRATDCHVTPEVAVHRVTCAPSGVSNDVVRCSGDVPMGSHARRIYLVSEPWDGGAP